MKINFMEKKSITALIWQVIDLRRRIWKGFFVLLAVFAALLIMGCSNAALGDEAEVEVVEVGVGEVEAEAGVGEVEAEVEDVKEQSLLAVWQDTLPRKSASITPEAVRGLSILREGEKELEVAYDPRAGKDSFDYWNLSVPYASYAVVNTEELFRLFTDITGLLTKLSPVDVKEAEQYEAVEGESGIFLAFLEGQRQGERGSAAPDSGLFLQIAGKDAAGNYLIQMNEEEQYYRAEGGLIDSLLSLDAYDYILKLPYLVNKDTVKKVTIQSMGQTMEMRKENNTCFFGDVVVEEKLYNEVYGKLMSVLTKKELDSAQAEEQKKMEPVFSLRYMRNTSEAPDYEIAWRIYDEEFMSVEVNGTLFFLAQRAEVEQLQESVQQSFETAGVGKKQ